MTTRESAPRRFYKAARTNRTSDGYGVTLDGRTLRTPSQTPFLAPTRALAEAVADEWAAQGERILPASMPITQLAFAAVDARGKRDERVEYVVAFAQTDLCCHRAEAPMELVARQAAAWGPLVAWGEEALGVSLPVVTGIIAANVPPGALARLRERTRALDDFRLTALAQATGLAGSALIGFALVEGRINAAEAFSAAALDDLWSQEHWGEDEEAAAGLERLKRDLEAVERFLRVLA